ncbi:MAG: hypothetical protein P8103_06765 [Candidatus Thiodiazotropha sp.]
MNRLLRGLVIAACCTMVGTASAGVNIIYPISGGTYPITNPAPGKLRSAYFTTSFGVTCGGGAHNVKWGVDKTQLGSARFYDQLSEQQVWKLPGGGHLFWVDAGRCGAAKVEFKIGN